MAGYRRLRRPLAQGMALSHRDEPLPQLPSRRLPSPHGGQHPRSRLALRRRDQLVESADDAGIGTADDMDARILLFEASQLCERVVSRAVVEDEKLKFALRLTQNAFDSSADVTRCVVDGKQH